VLDASGALIGMMSRRDLLRVFLRPDAEIGAEVHGYSPVCCWRIRSR